MGIKIIGEIILRFILAALGLFFLSRGTFLQNQFQHDAKSKVTFFIGFSLFVAVFVYIPRKCNGMLGKLRDMHFFVKGLMKFLLLGLFSVPVLLTKYPRFNFHPKYSADQELEQGHGNLFDLFGVGSFSAVALVISWERQHQEFGVFEFLLELTMDASMEIEGLDGKPNVWYMVGAYGFCFLLLIVQSYGRSFVSESGNDCAVDRQETCLELPEIGSAETDRRRCDSESIIAGALEEGRLPIMRAKSQRGRPREHMIGGVTESRDGILDGQTIDEDGHAHEE